MLLVSISSCFVSFGFFGGGGMTFEPMRDAQFHVNKKCVTQSKTGERKRVSSSRLCRKQNGEKGRSAAEKCFYLCSFSLFILLLLCVHISIILCQTAADHQKPARKYKKNSNKIKRGKTTGVLLLLLLCVRWQPTGNIITAAFHFRQDFPNVSIRSCFNQSNNQRGFNSFKIKTRNTKTID
jgi:hypothetical protein